MNIDKTSKNYLRAETNRLIEMCEDEILDPIDVILMLVKYMSEDDVADCMDANELSKRFIEVV